MFILEYKDGVKPKELSPKKPEVSWQSIPKGVELLYLFVLIIFDIAKDNVEKLTRCYNKWFLREMFIASWTVRPGTESFFKAADTRTFVSKTT